MSDEPKRLRSIFRPEVLEHAQRRLDGTVIFATPPSLKLLSALSACLLAVALMFAATAGYATKMTATGWIVPDRGLIRADAVQAGSVAAIYVHEGQVVKAGQPLAAIRTSTTIRAGDTGDILARAIQKEIDAQTVQSGAALDRLRGDQAAARARLGNLKSQLAEARRRAVIAGDQQKLAEDEVARLKPIVAMNYISQSQFDQFLASALSAASTSSAARSAVLDLQKQIDETQAALDASVADLAGLGAQAIQAHEGLSQKRAMAEANRLMVVAAQVDGRVAALPVSVGQSLSQGATVAMLTPANSKLIAEVYVPSRAIGFVHAGEQVQLMYQAFPFEIFGAAKGQVAGVSDAILAPGDLSVPGLAPQEPVFRVRVTLARQSMEAYGQPVSLKPGMLLSADVIVARRTLLQWLFDPLYAAARRQ